MADNKLRLQIVTALDNAGIKATKEQIDSLNKSISNTSSSASGLNDVEKTIGKMEGPFGKLQELFDKSQSKISQFGTKALAVASAFKIGWDMGTWIQEHIVEPLFGITDPIEELKKKNRQLKNEVDSVNQAFIDKSQNMASASTHEIQKIDGEIGNIEKLRQAWNKVHKAKIDYYNVNQDMELQKLERNRFEDTVLLQREGDFEGAEQLNTIYDFLKEQLIAKKQMETFDRESVALKEQYNDAAQKEGMLVEKRLELERRMQQLLKERQKIETDDYVGYDEKQYRKLMSANEKELRSVRLAMRANDIAIENANKEIDAYELDFATRSNKRILLADQLSLNTQKAAWNYDSNALMNGDLLGFSFTEEFIKEFNEANYKTADNLVKAISEGVTEGIGKLLEAK